MVSGCGWLWKEAVNRKLDALAYVENMSLGNSLKGHYCNWEGWVMGQPQGC